MRRGGDALFCWLQRVAVHLPFFCGGHLRLGFGMSSAFDLPLRGCCDGGDCARLLESLTFDILVD